MHHHFYDSSFRTFYANCLYWLNFFDPKEQAARAAQRSPRTPMPASSVWRTACSSKSATTRWRRPPPRASRGCGRRPRRCRRSPGEEGARGAGQHTPRARQVGGQRGFLDPADHGFWVTKHVAADAKLDARIITRLRALRGQSNPRASPCAVQPRGGRAATSRPRGRRGQGLVRLTRDRGPARPDAERPSAACSTPRVSRRGCRTVSTSSPSVIAAAQAPTNPGCQLLGRARPSLRLGPHWR
jgi:hypothetical protein